jgi:hypothetical protein
MLIGLYIFVEDDFDDPVYADPNPAELDEDVWVAGCESIQDALDEEGELQGVRRVGESLVAWRVLPRSEIGLLAIVTDDVKPPSVLAYLSLLGRRYLDEVDDPKSPERDGVADVVVDVIPPWEEEDE